MHETVSKVFYNSGKITSKYLPSRYNTIYAQKESSKKLCNAEFFVLSLIVGIYRRERAVVHLERLYTFGNVLKLVRELSKGSHSGPQALNYEENNYSV